MTRSIYVIDDDDAVRASLCGFLSVNPTFDVQSYDSGDAFLAAINDLDPGVLLLDYHMPGSSGLDVLHTVRKQGSSFAAVILTGRGDVTLAIEAMRAGAVDFLEKPYEHHVLLEAIEAAFSKLQRDAAASQRARQAKEKIGRLSPRERDVLEGLVHGRSNKIIAYDLAISPRTVEIYRAKLMDRMRVDSLSEALRVAFAAGMLPEEA